MSKHTPTPWTMLEVSDTYYLGTHDMEPFSDECHYLAGEPFVCKMNTDFALRGAHVGKKYIPTLNPERVKANASFIVRAVNHHDELKEFVRYVQSVLHSYEGSQTAQGIIVDKAKAILTLLESEARHE